MHFNFCGQIRLPAYGEVSCLSSLGILQTAGSARYKIPSLFVSIHRNDNPDCLHVASLDPPRPRPAPARASPPSPRRASPCLACLASVADEAGHGSHPVTGRTHQASPSHSRSPSPALSADGHHDASLQRREFRISNTPRATRRVGGSTRRLGEKHDGSRHPVCRRRGTESSHRVP